jgi:hypothetical protein
MNDKSLVGKKKWAFSGGEIPLKGTGKEPEFLSHDKLSILNCSGKDTTVKLTLYFANNPTAGTYKLEVKSQRVRKVRINDLIDPHAIPLGVPYGGYLESEEPIVVQFTRQYTAQNELAIMGTIAYGEDKT